MTSSEKELFFACRSLIRLMEIDGGFNCNSGGGCNGDCGHCPIKLAYIRGKKAISNKGCVK